MIRILLSIELGKRRWTQAKLARKTNIRPSTINDYYHELADRVSLQHLDAICDVLGCDLTDILSYTPDDGLDLKPHAGITGSSKPPKK